MQDPIMFFEKYLKNKGLKLTKERRIILETIVKIHSHFNIDELHCMINKKINISTATIYRTIPLLIDANLIKISHRCMGKDFFEYVEDVKNHIHLICKSCGNIIEEHCQIIENEMQRISIKYGFNIESLIINAKGKCKKCNEME